MIWHQIGGRLRLRVGAKIRSTIDPRLGVGEVEAVWNSSLAKIRWEETGWLSWLPLEDIVPATQTNEEEREFQRQDNLDQIEEERGDYS